MWAWYSIKNHAGKTMASYSIEERWVFEESDAPDDESRKEVQIVRRQDNNGIYVRTAYYGPSGRYGQDAPTFSISEDTQEDFITALQKAFPRARELRRRRKIEEAYDDSELEPDEFKKLAELAKEAGGVEALEERLK